VLCNGHVVVAHDEGLEAGPSTRLSRGLEVLELLDGGRWTSGPAAWGAACSCRRRERVQSGEALLGLGHEVEASLLPSEKRDGGLGDIRSTPVLLDGSEGELCEMRESVRGDLAQRRRRLSEMFGSTFFQHWQWAGRRPRCC
jgi:hypothetical protein